MDKSDTSQTTDIQISPGIDGGLSFVFQRGAVYAYIDCGPNNTLHVYHDLPGREKYEMVGVFTSPALLEQIELIEEALRD